MSDSHKRLKPPIMPHQVRQTRNPALLVRFLREHGFLSIPDGLFDRRLWMYGALAEHLYDITFQPKRYRGAMFAFFEDGPVAVGLLRKSRGNITLSIDAVSSTEASSLVRGILDMRTLREITVHTPRIELLSDLSQAEGITASPGAVFYYTDSCSNTDEYPVRELSASDERLVRSIMPRRWPAFARMIELGIRFFAVVVEDSVKSMCGLAQLTTFHSHIIGAETFSPADKRKGMARAVAAAAILAGLRDTRYVSWSTHSRNTSSCRTAESAGMTALYTIYSLTVRRSLQGT